MFKIVYTTDDYIEAWQRATAAWRMLQGLGACCKAASSLS
jgi:hypothetical protein